MYLLKIREVGLEGRGVELFYTAIIFPSIALATVLARFACRHYYARRIGIDDWVIATSMLSAILLSVATCFSVNHGIGKHLNTLSPNDIHQALFSFYLSQPLHTLTLALTKTSILLLYHRIFPLRTPPLRTYRLLTNSTIAFVLTYSSISILVTIFQCTPVSRAWGDRQMIIPPRQKKMPGRGKKKCVNLTAFWFVNAVVNIVGDLVVFALPVPILWKLQMPWGEKVGLLPVFGLGVFVITTSTLRTTTLPLASESPDPTHDTMLLTLWSNVEANTGILCACIPTLKKPLTHLYTHLHHRLTNTVPSFSAFSASNRTNNATCFASRIRSDSSRTIIPPVPLSRTRGEELLETRIQHQHQHQHQQHQQHQQGSTHSTDARSASSASSSAGAVRKEDGSVVHLV